MNKNEFQIYELPEGEELSKLIIYNYIINKKDLSEYEKIKLALKYQLFIEGTSLFAEIELSKKIKSELKHQTKIKNEKDSVEGAIQKLEETINNTELLLDNLQNKVQILKREAKKKIKNGRYHFSKQIYRRISEE